MDEKRRSWKKRVVRWKKVWRNFEGSRECLWSSPGAVARDGFVGFIEPEFKSKSMNK